MKTQIIVSAMLCVLILPLGITTTGLNDNHMKVPTIENGILSCVWQNDDNNNGTEYWNFHITTAKSGCTGAEADGMMVVAQSGEDAVMYRRNSASTFRKVTTLLSIPNIQVRLYGSATSYTLDLGEDLTTTGSWEYSGSSTESDYKVEYTGTVGGNYMKFVMYYQFSKDTVNGYGQITIVLDYWGTTRLDRVKMFTYNDVDLRDYTNNNCWEWYSGAWHQISVEGNTNYEMKINDPDDGYRVKQHYWSGFDSVTNYVFQWDMESPEDNGDDSNEDTSNQDLVMTQEAINNGDFDGSPAADRIGSLTYDVLVPA